jgi:hypothetical protein
MFGWTCTLVTAFPVGIVATIQEWPRLSGYVDDSHVPVDVEVWERRRKVNVCRFAYAVFSSGRTCGVHRFSIAVTIPHAIVLVFSTPKRAIAIKYISSRLMIKRFNP